MIRKNKVIIGVCVLTVAALTLGLILGGLDRLDNQKYGLNYNYITANFSQQIVYEGGLHLVGPSNVLLEVPRTYQTVDIGNVSTFSSDYFGLEVTAQVSYRLLVPSTNENSGQFKILSKFYMNFGGRPQETLVPIFRNEVIKIVSNYSSADYQTANISLAIESRIQVALKTALARWSDLDIIVLLSSIICKGVSFDLQSRNRRISSLALQSSRMQARKTDLTTLMQSVMASTRIKMGMVYDAIARKVASMRPIQLDQGVYSGAVLQSVQAVGGLLGLASTELKLRPETYLLNATHYY